MKPRIRSAVPLVAVMLLSACARSSSSSGAKPAKVMSGKAPTPCEKVAPGCHVKRLPDVVLRNGAANGALKSVDGPLEDIISSDEALAAAWREDGHADADKVQVTLGSADAKALHWDSLCDSACDLFYAIDWSGVSVCSYGGAFSVSPRPPRCYETTWGTVIDAHTGAFIVGGNG